MLSNSQKKYNNLILLPHLDDEFALSPIMKFLDRQNTKIIFCAERLDANSKLVQKRRKESILSALIMGFERYQISYLNDFFEVNDCFLFNSARKIYNHLCNTLQKEKFNRIFTLALEGGHPDHDSLALIVDKFCKRKKIEKYFFPAYNYNYFSFIPFTALIPLKSMKYKAKFISIGKFCWGDSIKIALIYKSEKSAFLKLFPFILFMFFFKNGIYYFDEISLNEVDWNSSLAFKRYKIELNEILNMIITL